LTVAAQTPDDTMAIQQLRNGHSLDHNKHDAQAMAARFTEDADRMTAAGEFAVGREAIRQGYITQLAGVDRNATFKDIRPLHVRFLSPDIAVADTVEEVTGRPTGVVQTAVTFICVKRSGKWMIAGIRNARLN
jgi:uncharacterized protein (TIGR02246 family)